MTGETLLLLDVSAGAFLHNAFTDLKLKMGGGTKGFCTFIWVYAAEAVLFCPKLLNNDAVSKTGSETHFCYRMFAPAVQY